ncbi:hypothetical protein EVAR_97102_1 [Eumeta japonica]|uniref:Uncharacterized protein n=1 Tax=Eumeta variegata TaxID=151549 RepID=A0A4C1X8M3_EUMVA|nr:hypothetical protein EVAR_97102_1 [Eumeta japonica]
MLSTFDSRPSLLPIKMFLTLAISMPVYPHYRSVILAIQLPCTHYNIASSVRMHTVGLWAVDQRPAALAPPAAAAAAVVAYAKTSRTTQLHCCIRHENKLQMGE